MEWDSWNVEKDTSLKTLGTVWFGLKGVKTREERIGFQWNNQNTWFVSLDASESCVSFKDTLLIILFSKFFVFWTNEFASRYFYVIRWQRCLLHMGIVFLKGPKSDD